MTLKKNRVACRTIRGGGVEDTAPGVDNVHTSEETDAVNRVMPSRRASVPVAKPALLKPSYRPVGPSH